MSDNSLLKHVGAFVKHHRVGQNKTQSTLAAEAGISRSTLSLLERGEFVNLATLIQVLRVLDKLHWMESFAVQETISPLALAKLEKAKRKRVRGSNTPKSQQSDW